MTKKAKIWTGVGVGTGVVALALGLGLGLGLSHASSSYYKVSTRSFQVKETVTTFAADGSKKEVNQWSADMNSDAINIKNEYLDKLSVDQLQEDFDKALSKFYAAFEQEKGRNEIEIDHDLDDGNRGVKVLSKNSDGTFKLEVRVEQEINGKESIKKVIINDWKPEFELMSKADIINLTKKLVHFNHDNKTANGEIDLEDIAEIYLGDDWNEPWDKNKDVDDLFDKDDKGIFDQIKEVNQEYENLAYLISYKVDLGSFFGKLESSLNAKSNEAVALFLKTRSGAKVNVDLSTTFLVPSLSLNGAVALVPNEKPAFAIDNVLDKTQYDNAFAKPTITPNDTEFNDIFGKSSQGWKDSVKDVTTDSSTGTVTINYNDPNKIPDQIQIGQTMNLTPKA